MRYDRMDCVSGAMHAYFNNATTNETVSALVIALVTIARYLPQSGGGDRGAVQSNLVDCEVCLEGQQEITAGLLTLREEHKVIKLD